MIRFGEFLPRRRELPRLQKSLFFQDKHRARQAEGDLAAGRFR
jgi:hypothetical protein